MLLSPQHFQQQERSLLQLARALHFAGHPFAFGFTELKVNVDALKNGRIALVSASGVLPDGTPFSLPVQERLPAERTLEPHFGQRLDVLPVTLGFPLESAERASVGDAAAPGAPGPRYSPEFVDLSDAHTRTGPRKLAVSSANPALLFPDDATAEYSWLPMVEVVRTPEGGYALRDEFVPPILSIGASEWMMRGLRRRLERLVTLSGEVARRRRHRGDQADFASTDTVSFWRLHTVNTAIPRLAHFLDAENRHTHPERVYETLATLAGSLCSMHPEHTPRDVPPYRHQDLRATFTALDALLDKLDQDVTVTNFISVPLKKEGVAFKGELRDLRLFDPTTRWYLGVRTDLDETRAIVDLPQSVKIASTDRIESLIAYALSGLPLRHERVPPPTLPVRKGTLYFEIEKRGDEWEPIAGAKNLAAYLPPEIPSPDLELWGIPR